MRVRLSSFLDLSKRRAFFAFLLRRRGSAPPFSYRPMGPEAGPSDPGATGRFGWEDLLADDAETNRRPRVPLGSIRPENVVVLHAPVDVLDPQWVFAGQAGPPDPGATGIFRCEGLLADDADGCVSGWPRNRQRAASPPPGTAWWFLTSPCGLCVHKRGAHPSTVVLNTQLSALLIGAVFMPSGGRWQLWAT